MKEALIIFIILLLLLMVISVFGGSVRQGVPNTDPQAIFAGFPMFAGPQQPERFAEMKPRAAGRALTPPMSEMFVSEGAKEAPVGGERKKPEVAMIADEPKPADAEPGVEKFQCNEQFVEAFHNGGGEYASWTPSA
jgi:hypothetical protein